MKLGKKGGLFFHDFFIFTTFTVCFFSFHFIEQTSLDENILQLLFNKKMKKKK